MLPGPLLPPEYSSQFIQESRYRWGFLYNLCRNRSPRALESRYRWRFACNLLRKSALALKFCGNLFKRRAPDAQAPRSRAHV
eukprot:8115162-Pyramimonas_sp.AAC.1